MTQSTRPKTRAITDALAPEQAQTFLELVQILKQQPDHENLLIRDKRGEVLGCLFLPECHASPDDPPTDPEFLKELERRLQSPAGPVIMLDDGFDLDDLLDYDEEEPA